VIRTLASGEESEIPTVFQNPTAAMWFPDGGSLLFTARNEGMYRSSLHRVDMKTGAELIRQKIEGDFATISADGRTIYFVRNGGPRSDASIVAYDLESQRETEVFKGKIPAGQGQRRLVLSPDGKQIAFTSTVEPVASLTAPNPTATRSVIYIVPTSGGPARKLQSPESQQIRAIQWSPNGKNVLAQRGNGQLWWVPADGGEAQRIGTGGYPLIESIHPDGKQIALTKNTRDANAIRDRELWRDPDLLNPKPAVSPENGIYIASIDAATGKVTGPAVRLTEMPGDCAPSWAPDGKSIAFKRNGTNPNNQNQKNWVVRSLDTGSEKLYTVNVPNCWSAPVWFHDGKSLLAGSFLEQNQGAMRMDLSTGQPVGLQFPTYKPAMALSPDDKTLYLTVEDQKDKTTSIVSVNLASGEQKMIWTSPIAADPTISVPLRLALSPDGRTFALVLTDAKKSHLIRVGIDGSGFREIYSAESGGAGRAEISRSGLVWSRDGRSILFMNWDSNKSQRLMRIAAEGSGKAEFTGLEIPSTDEIFDLSPDGKRIVFFSPRAPILP
jgi:Tol biopolymer transport system component